MTRPKHEVAQIIRAYGQDFIKQYPQSTHHLRTLQALSQCRTASLGGHLDRCDSCGRDRISYNSCRNRHCPKCQGLARERWMRAREAELLPVPYFHLVFTLPHQLNPLCLAHPEMMYPMLFCCAWQTVQTFAADHKYLGARTAMTAILHTWGQNLSLHPHIHAIVPGGGITEAGKWKTAKGEDKFLFPTKAMSIPILRDRAKFSQALTKLWKSGKLTDKGVGQQPKTQEDFARLRQSLYRKSWVIYAKRPFAGPKQVVEYLGRYTHRIAISNHRLEEVKDGKVQFVYKNYRKNGKKGSMRLDATEFLRRFALHILPHRFVRIRHYGFLAPNLKGEALASIRQQLGIPASEPKNDLDWKALLKSATGIDIDQCPRCKSRTMRMIHELPRAPSRHRLIPV
ncbi:MAG: IS91 family transposase [Bacteroidota bacterium]